MLILTEKLTFCLNSEISGSIDERYREQVRIVLFMGICWLKFYFHIDSVLHICVVFFRSLVPRFLQKTREETSGMHSMEELHFLQLLASFYVVNLLGDILIP